MTIQQDYQQKPRLAKEFTATGIIGPASLSTNMMGNLRVAVEGVGVGNVIAVQGRLLGQTNWQTLGTINGSTSGQTVSVSIVDEIRFNCTTYSASGTPKLICSGFSLIGGATIGGTVSGGTDQGVLFVHPSGVLAQDAGNFNYQIGAGTLRAPALWANTLNSSSGGLMVDLNDFVIYDGGGFPQITLSNNQELFLGDMNNVGIALYNSGANILQFQVGTDGEIDFYGSSGGAILLAISESLDESIFSTDLSVNGNTLNLNRQGSSTGGGQLDAASGSVLGIGKPRASAGGILYRYYTDVGNSGTSETDLISSTLVADTFFNNGDTVESDYSGIFIPSATASRRVRAYLGGTLIYDSTALTSSVTASWSLSMKLIREAAGVVRCTVTPAVGVVTMAPTYTRVTGLTLSSTNILKITGTAAGTGAASNDIVAKYGAVKWY